MATINVADLNRQGKVFTAANVSAKSVIAVAAAMTGLVLYNPVSSGKKLVLIDAGWSYTTGPAAAHNIGIGVMNSSPTAPATLTVAGSPAQAADGSGYTGAGIAWDAATLPAAPVARRWFAYGATAAGVVQIQDRIDGSIVLVPGSAAALIALTTTAVGVGSFTWAEFPI